MGAKWIPATICLTVAVARLGASTGVTGSPHDLSTTGGRDACSFCHTPHGATLKVPRWSSKQSTTVYKIYQSSSLEANVGQPTGASKLCLSCHDGTVATAHTGGGSGGAYVAPGQANLGTDLSDDHPISFVYSDALAARDSQIRSPLTLPEHLELDRLGELQCTTCHTPHDNQHGHFLVTSNRRSELCVTCHDLDGWIGSGHEMSGVSISATHNRYLVEGGLQTVADYACQSCHRPHSAGHGERLLHFDESEENCFSCHDGTVAAANIKSQTAKPSRHDVAAYRDIHDLRESPIASPRHVECVDCHNAHATQDVQTQAPVIPGAMQRVTGVSASGAPLQQARYEYEVCFKCHADNPSRIESRITRQITQTNTRLEFDPSGPSYHPIVAPGASKNVPSLRPPMTVGTVLFCTDCHGSDSGSRTKGPHGSRYWPILTDNYSVADYTSESESAYALCYRCHSRNSILGDESFPKHRLHLDERVPCSACHDAHGISSAQGTRENNSHLINFDTTIVSPEPDSGLLEFSDLGVFRGQCTLTCHGQDHEARQY